MVIIRPARRAFAADSALSGSILDLGNAQKHCKDQVRKYDFYAWRVGHHFPSNKQPHYFALNAFFLETLKSREISKEQSICQTRLTWWQQSLNDILNGKKAREPVARAIQAVMEDTHVNMKVLSRLVDFQLFDIERGTIQTMKELEVYAENTRSLMLYLNLHLLGIDD